MKKAPKAYERLIAIRREAALLESCSALLQWDQETCLPAGGNDGRAEQLALLARLAHEKFTVPEMGEYLALCESSGLVADPESLEAVNVRELRRRYDKKTKLPPKLVEAIAHTAALAHPAWVKARQSSRYKIFLPWLKKLDRLKREQAEALQGAGSLYDALLDDFEPGAREADLEPLFAGLRAGIVPLVQKITGAPRRPDVSILKRDYPVERQKMFGELAAAALGFDFHSGRLDQVVHPFCSTTGPGDTRITTRYNPNNFSEAFFGILHEAGHGMYEQGLPAEHFGTPLGDSVSLGIHESQSRLWENFVGRGAAFWRHFFPLAQGVFQEPLREISLESFVHAVNEVRCSFIRVEADEVTYNLHIILRFELERALISGDLAPADVPSAWNERFKGLLGLEVPDDRRGCLQDVHWSAGLFGYFPTYCLGNLYAAQIYAAALRAVPGLEPGFSEGRFEPLLGWLREKIHRQGMRYRAAELIRRVTGGSLDTQPLLDYLDRKYAELYGF